MFGERKKHPYGHRGVDVDAVESPTSGLRLSSSELVAVRRCNQEPINLNGDKVRSADVSGGGSIGVSEPVATQPARRGRTTKAIFLINKDTFSSVSMSPRVAQNLILAIRNWSFLNLPKSQKCHFYIQPFKTEV